MKTIKKIMEDPNTYEAVMADCIRVLDDEVKKKSGLIGMGIKAGYKLVRNVKEGRLLQAIIAVLIPEFVDKLDPHYERFQKEGKGTDWNVFLKPHYDEIAEGFLSVTDEMAKKSTNKALRGTYDKLRPKSKKEVVASMPALLKMMEKYI